MFENCSFLNSLENFENVYNAMKTAFRLRFYKRLFAGKPLYVHFYSQRFVRRQIVWSSSCLQKVEDVSIVTLKK